MGIIKEQVEKDRLNNEETSKYEQALSLYDTQVDEHAVEAAIQQLISEKLSENDTPEVKKFLLGSVEHTSLRTEDTEESILAMVERVNKFDSEYPHLPHVAALCAYPTFTELIANSLEVDGVDITNVTGNFPSSQARMEVKVAETSLAVADGATQIDIVLPVGKFLSGDYEGVCDDIAELKRACGEIPLKVILEVCLLGSLENVKKAALLCMYAGADYIKTSTGKEKGGATYSTVYTMCQAIKEYYDKTGIMVGLKPAGGINTVHDALVYYTILKEVCGSEWLTNYWFRLGTSRLTNLLISEIEGKEIKFF